MKHFNDNDDGDSSKTEIYCAIKNGEIYYLSIIFFYNKKLIYIYIKIKII